ncbi:tRNA 2-thiocytidine biosynthesis protein TtcA, partial [candidate division KSB1 bacterium]|nr:tRNA 2-thiocytidine biosynthesis protein TtcA [candidate division KSB1 bacterium]
KMFAPGDRVLMAVSGGADSVALLDLLSLRIPVYAKDIQLNAVYIDLGFGNRAPDRVACMERYFASLNVPGTVCRTDIGPYSHSEENRENPCFLCSRIRRKKIFETAEELECNKVVFGHHKEDIIETLLLNMIFNREISTMNPNLSVFQGKYNILRPLVFVEEELIKKYCYERSLPCFDQECPTDGHSKRAYVKELLNRMESDFRGSKENIFASMKKVKIDYLL